MNNKTTRRLGSRLFAVLLSLAMITSLFAMHGSAAKANFAAPTKSMKIDKSQITVAAHSQGYITPEVLGLTNTTSRSMELPANDDGTVGMAYDKAQQMAVLGVFGSDINKNPNPFLYNYFFNTYAQATDGVTPSGFGTYTLSKDVGGGPPSAAASGGYNKYGIIVPASLYLEPDILIGISPISEDGKTTGYTNALNAYNEAKQVADPAAGTYDPYQVSYEMAHVYSFLQTLYDLSDIVDEIKKNDSSKTTRYGDPQIISGDVEKYVKGLVAYTQKKLKEDNAKPLVVACVDTGYTKTLKDGGNLAAGQYVLNDKTCSTQATTAYSRVGEFVADCCTNIIDAIGGLERKSGDTTNSFANDYYVATADQIIQNADVILFCDVLSSVPENQGNSKVDEFKQDLADHATTASLRNKVNDIEMMSSTFDCVGSIGANSVENLLGMAYYTAYLYPQYLNQFDVAAYWYQNFYHVSDLDKLQSVMANNFATSSVQNAYADKYSAAKMNYSKDDVEAKIIEGMRYYENNKSEFKGKLLDQDGKTGKEGWIIDWDNGIGAGQKDEPTPVEPDEPAAKLNGVVKGPQGWGYYKDDVLQTNYTGIKNNKLGWWRIENGKVNFNATGIYKNEYGWWRVEDGKVNFKAQGIYKNEYGWWKTTDGKVTFKETGVFKNDYGWWRVKDSKVDFKANGIYKNPYGWWKTTNGKVTFKENGLFKNEYGTWKVENSKVNFKYNGTYQGKTIKGGKVV